jgi:hypothetical protein
MWPSVIALFVVSGVGCDGTNPPSDRGSLQVLIGNGDGTFSSGWSAPIHMPRAVAVADLDGDSRSELAVARYDNAVATYAETVAGEFELQYEYEVDPWPSSITALDANSDGMADLVVGCAGSLNVLLGKGAGQLTPPQKFPGGENAAIATLDFNRDSILDVALVRQSNVIVLLGKQDGTFDGFQEVALPAQLHAIATADVNDDGNTDILATATTIGLLVPDYGTVFVLLGGPTAFSLTGSYDAANAGQDVTVADINNDAKPDLLVPGHDSVDIGFGVGDGTFAAFTEHLVGSFARSVIVSDFNADVTNDLAVLRTSGYVTTLLGTPSGLRWVDTYAVGHAPVAFLATDVNDDGRIDLLIVNEGGQGLP